MKTVFIYALKDPRDGAVRYIGKAVNPKERLYQHIWRSRHNITHKDSWIISLVSIGKSPELELLDEVVGTQQNFFERAYIKVYRESGADLTNHTDGGDGGGPGRPKGFKHSEETKKLQSQLMLGKFVGEKNPMFGHTHTPEAIAKQRAAKLGKGVGSENPFFGHTHTEEALALMRKPKSEEHKQALSKALTGTKLSPERCASISKAMTGIKRGPYKKKVKTLNVR